MIIWGILTNPQGVVFRGSRLRDISGRRAVRGQGAEPSASSQRIYAGVACYVANRVVFCEGRESNGRGALLGGFPPPAARLPTPAAGHDCPKPPRWSRLSRCPWVVGHSFCYRWLQNGAFLSLYRCFCGVCRLETAACCRFLLRAAVPSANLWHFWAAPGKTGVQGAAYRRQGTRVAPPEAAHAPATCGGLRRQSYNAPFWDTCPCEFMQRGFCRKQQSSSQAPLQIDRRCGIILKRQTAATI